MRRDRMAIMRTIITRMWTSIITRRAGITTGMMVDAGIMAGICRRITPFTRKVANHSKPIALSPGQKIMLQGALDILLVANIPPGVDIPRVVEVMDMTIGDINHAFSTSMNASCGMFTLPMDFIRFLPSFCFSSSLRLRETSPP